MEKKRSYIIIFFLFCVFILIFILNLVIENFKNKGTNQQENQGFNQRNIRDNQVKTNQLDNFQNNLKLITSFKDKEDEIRFTGVKEEPVPKEETEKLDQQNKLINQLPVDNDFFSLNFDYKEALFIVTIKEPKEENQKKFEGWLKENYPLIPKDKFTFQ